jgi:hypothetical protein
MLDHDLHIDLQLWAHRSTPASGSARALPLRHGEASVRTRRTRTSGPRPTRQSALAGPALSGVGVARRLALDDVFPELGGGAGEAHAELGGAHARGLLRAAGEALEDRLVVAELLALARIMQ